MALVWCWGGVELHSGLQHQTKEQPERQPPGNRISHFDEHEYMSMSKDIDAKHSTSSATSGRPLQNMGTWEAAITAACVRPAHSHPSGSVPHLCSPGGSCAGRASRVSMFHWVTTRPLV